MSDLYERIKALCEVRGLSLYALANKTGIPQSRFSELKRNTRTLTPKNLQLVAAALNTSVDDLLYRDRSVVLDLPGDGGEADWTAFVNSLPKETLLKMMRAIAERLSDV